MSSGGQGNANRPKISLPSFKEVQAAQKSRPAPNFFRSNSQGAAPQASASQKSATPSADVGRAAAPPAANQSSAYSGPSGSRQPNSGQPQGVPYGNGQASGAAGPSRPYNDAGPSSRPDYNGAGPSHSAFPVAYPQQGPGVDYQALNASPNAVLVSRRQEGNPLLKHIRNVRWTFADIVPDYIMGADSCALFLSMRFHLLKPEYIHHRIKELQRSFRLRVLMCHVDIDDVIEPLQQITRAALLNDVTLICGWSYEECARYLETYKVYETKNADSILGHTDEDYLSRLNAAFTSVRGVNKSDVLTLATTFKTAGGMMQASIEDMSACPGIGPTKVKRLYDAFHEPFRKVLPVGNSAQPTAAQSAATASSSREQAALPTQMPMDEVQGCDDSEADE